MPVKLEPRPFPQPLRPASSGTILLDSPSPPARKKSRVEILPENSSLHVENQEQNFEVEEVEDGGKLEMEGEEEEDNKDGGKVEVEGKEEEDNKMDIEEDNKDRGKVEVEGKEEEDNKMDIEEEEATVEQTEEDHFPRVGGADDF